LETENNFEFNDGKNRVEYCVVENFEIVHIFSKVIAFTYALC